MTISFGFYKDGYILTQPLWFAGTGLIGGSYDSVYMKLLRNGDLLLKTGYTWDGRSGPALDTANALRSSAAHDAMYQILRNGIVPNTRKNRRIADKYMRKVDKDDGVNAFRRWYSYIALRLFGGFYLRR